jgi:hypothetical protein
MCALDELLAMKSLGSVRKNYTDFLCSWKGAGDEGLATGYGPWQKPGPPPGASGYRGHLPRRSNGGGERGRVTPRRVRAERC